MTRRSVFALVPGLMFALGLPAIPAAADLLALHWNSCAETVTPPVQAFACDTNSGASFDLLYSMNPFTVMSGANGAMIQGWIQTAEAALPDWWQAQPGGCREGALTVDASPPFPVGCADPWQGAAVVQTTFEHLACRPNGLQFSSRATLPAGSTRTLSPGNRYAMFRLRISRAGATGAGNCTGCSLDACIGVGFIFVSRDPAMGGSGWSMSPASYARWQGTASDCGDSAGCGPTGERTPTWGAIKSLYR